MKRLPQTIAKHLSATALAVSCGLPLCTLATARAVQPAQPSPTQPSTLPIDPDAVTRALPRVLAGTLNDAALPQSQRDEAARRLLGLGESQVNDLLLAALTDANPGGQQAVATAIADLGSSNPIFIAPLFASLSGTTPAVADAAAAALSGYHGNGEVLVRLVDLANSRQRVAERTRVAAIRALGAFSEKRAAEALVGLVRNPQESGAIRNNAMESLATLTGLPMDPPNVRRWEQWWSENLRRSDNDFRGEMNARKAAARDRDATRIPRIAAELRGSLREQYRLAEDAQQREAILLRWLHSAEPEVRAYAAVQVREDITVPKTVSAVVIDELRTAIGDSNPTVRRSVVQALAAKNDAASLEPLLVQLAHESDALTRQYIANALQRIGDLRAAPSLLGLLDDGSPGVVRASVTALKDMGQRLVEQRPDLADQAATSLRQIIDQTSDTDQIELRAAAVDALAPLKRKALISLYFQMLRRQEPAVVRIAALSALGETGDPQTADAIINALSDPDGSVVYAAVQALGKVNPSAVQLEALAPFLVGRNMRDQSIRDVAWTVLQSNLPEKMSKEQLSLWADRLRNDSQKQIIVLQELALAQTRDKDLDNLATTQQQIADSYMALGQPDQAVPFYRAALEYLQTASVAGQRIDRLIEGYMQALLKSGKHEEAVVLAEKTLSGDKSKQPQMGSLIRSRVEDLQKTGQPDDLRKALALIARASKMSTPLSEQYADQLETLRKSIDKRLAELSQPNGPRSASDVNAPLSTRADGGGADGG